MRTTHWMVSGLIGFVLGGALPARAQEVPLLTPRPTPVAQAGIADYLSGTQWTIDGSGRLLRKETVTVVLAIDEDNQTVRQVVLAADPRAPLAPRVIELVLEDLRRAGPLVQLAASTTMADGSTVRIKMSARGSQAYAHETWLAPDGTVTRTVVRVATRVTRLEVDQTLGSLVTSLEAHVQ